MVAYVVDSNCFIHMGGMATTTILNDLKSALKTMHVTKGVHGEIQNVRYQRWKNKPNLLNHIKPLLTTHEILDDQIRGLGAKIGERASPQDVDLSLMVLAYDMQREGHHVVLVTDDFKMAKATEEHQLASEVCPPSTFFERLSTKAKGKHASELRRLGRRIRAAEMQYAISRRNEYDVQAKITWMVDSLLSSTPSKRPQPQVNQGGTSSVDLLNELNRMIQGEDIKSSIRKKLAPLKASCQGMMELEHHVAQLKKKLSKESLEEIIIETQALIANSLENVGIDLAPLDRELVDTAHRFHSRILVRAEMALAIMKRMKGDAVGSHLHLSTALFQATHVDDDIIEARILARLAVLALSTNKFEKAIRLSTSSLGLNTLSMPMKLKQHIVQAMAQYLTEIPSDGAIKHAQTMVHDDVAMAAQALTELGESFLALNRPDFAIELFDEALECVSAEQKISEELGELILLAHRAMEESDIEIEGLRQILDQIHQQTVEQEKQVEDVVEQISKRQQDSSELVVSNEWQDSSSILNDERPLYISNVVGDASEEQLILAQHPSLGSVGIWLPAKADAPQPGAKITLTNGRVKIAEPPKDVAESYSIRALIAIEFPESLVFQSLTSDAQEELEDL
ncbi:MAG: tetratricopeptide repeat protein [Candidatus Thermoplasmatota archaeon]|nr:tetratricopeptide repeat protein [Candidatus Thermoplasmatota archaeon]